MISRFFRLTAWLVVLLPGWGLAVDLPQPLSTAAGGANWGWAPSTVANMPPYSAVGAVLVDMGGEARGSGCLVLSHIVLTCGHMLVDERGNWASNIRWSRARSAASTGVVTAAQSAVDSTYRSRLQQGASQEDRASFGLEWGYMAFYGSAAGTRPAAMMPGYMSALDPGGQSGYYEIVGYPAGRYPNPSDPRRDEMHSTNPGTTYARFRRGPNFNYNGTAWLSSWFNTPSFYIYSGNSGGPLFASVNGAKYVVGIAVSGSNSDTGCRELTSSLYNTLVAANEAYRSWVSSPVASCRSGTPVKIHQAWRQAFTIGSDGRLQSTFFNGSAWQTVSLGGQVLDQVAAPFDVDAQRGMIFYLAGGDVWVAYPRGSAWLHARALDYGPAVSGVPVAVTCDPARQVVGVQQSNSERRLLYLSSWTSAASSLPAGRVVGQTMWGPMAWDYRAGGNGIVGRFFYGGWRTIDLTSKLGVVLPGESNPATTPGGKIAPLLGGLVYASTYSTLELLYPSGSSWFRYSLQGNVNPRSWVAVDNLRNNVFFLNPQGTVSLATAGATSWPRTDTTFSSSVNASGGVLEAFGTLFHATGSSLNVCSLY